MTLFKYGMTNRLILTVDQARTLQRQAWVEESDPDSQWCWPGDWQDVYKLIPPKEPHSRPCSTRAKVSMRMLERGCTSEQVAEQMNWYADAPPLLAVVARYERQIAREDKPS